MKNLNAPSANKQLHYSRHAGVMSFFMAMMMLGCASTQSTVVPETPAAPVVVDETPSEVEIPEVDSIPAISPELAKLRELVDSAKDDEIEAHAHHMIDADPKKDDTQEAYRALAEISIRRELYSQAQLYIQTAMESHSKDYDNVMMQARISRLMGQNDESVKWLKEASEIAPDKSEPYIQKAGILLTFLDVERALESAAKAHDLAPADCRASVIHADALFANHQFPESIAQYEAAEKAACSLSEAAVLNMAKLYEIHIQDPKKACQTYEKLVKTAPENAYYKASRDYQCSL